VSDVLETQLLALAREVAVDRVDWQARVSDDWSERWYSLLDRNDELEIWLQGWPASRGIDLHDHGSSSGALVVVEGSLVETYLDAGRPRRPRALRRRRWSAGQAVSFGPDHVHDLSNRRAAPALSIHAYSPPLTSMTFYDSSDFASSDFASSDFRSLRSAIRT